mgnify:CR=1 FL=1
MGVAARWVAIPLTKSAEGAKFKQTEDGPDSIVLSDKSYVSL